MDELNGYAQNIQERWDYHHGPTKVQRDLAAEAAWNATAPKAEPNEGTQSAQPTPTPNAGGHVPNPLEALGAVGETLSAPIRMLILQGLGKPLTTTGKDGQLTGEDFKTNLGLNGPESTLGEKALGLGAEILTDPTSAMPLGGKGTQKAIPAGAEAAQGVIKKLAEAGKTDAALQRTVPEATALTDATKTPMQEVEDLIKADPTMPPKKQQVMRESVGIPTSAYGRHAKAVFNQKAGLDTPVVDDQISKVFGYKIGDSAFSKSQYEFLQDVISEEAAHSGVSVVDYQRMFGEASKVLEKHPELEASIAKMAVGEAEDIARMSAVAGKVLNNEAGVARTTAALLLTRIVAGGAIGATVSEDELQGAMIGMGVALSPEVLSTLHKAMKKAAPDAMATAKAAEAKARGRKPIPAWKPGYAESRFKELRDDLVQRAAKDVPRPLSQVEAEAQALLQYQEVSPDTLKSLMPNAVLNDVEMKAAQMVVAESADHVRTMAMNTDVTNVAEVQEFMRQLYVHGHMDLGRKFAEGGIGRALRVVQEKNGEQMAINQMEKIVGEAMSGVSPQRIVELARQTYSKDHLTKFANSMSKPSFKDMFVEYWVNGLLSSPKTWIINPTSSALFHLWNIGEKGMSVLYGNVQAPREAFSMAQGTMVGMKQAFMLAKHMFRDENATSKFATSKLEWDHHAITAENLKNLTPLKALGEVTKPLFSKVEEVGPLGAAIDFLSHATTKSVDAFGKVTRISRRVMLSQDEFARSIAYSSETHRAAFLNASADVDAAGLTGKAAREMYKARYKHWIENPSAETVANAKEYGSYITFTKMLGESGQALQQLSHSSAAMKAALPFITAPVNVAKTGFLERTPLGLFSETFRAELRAGGERKQMALTRMSMGAAFLAMASEWATQGIIVTPTEQDKGLRKALREGGQLPFAINLSAIQRGDVGRADTRPLPGDTLLDYTKLDPTLAAPLALAGLFTQARARMHDEDAQNIALELSIAVGEYVGQKSWLSGAAGITSAFTDPHQYLDNWANRQVGTLVPMSGMMGTSARAVDPIKRDPQSVWQSILVKLPYLSTKVIPDRNRYGDIVHYPPALGIDEVSPFYYDTVKDDKVLRAMQEDQMTVEKLPPKVMGVTLTDSEYDEYRVIFGKVARDREGRTLRQAEEAVLEEARSDGHTTGPESWRRAKLMAVDQEFRIQAQRILLKRHEDLKEKVLTKDAERRMKLDKPSESRLRDQIDLTEDPELDFKVR